MAIPIGGCYAASGTGPFFSREGNAINVFIRLLDVRNGIPIPVCNVSPGLREFLLPMSETGSFEVRLFARAPSANLILTDYLQGTRTVTVSEAVAVAMNSPIALLILVISLAVFGSPGVLVPRASSPKVN